MKNATKALTKQLKRSTQAQAILAVLSEGAEFTAAECRDAGIANPNAVVTALRQAGYEIYSNSRKTKSGDRVNKYRLNVRQ